MKRELMKQKEEMVPGFGVAGQVMCPFSMMAPKLCMKQGCELWMELNCGGQKVARCSFAWTSILLVEMRQAIDRLTPAQPAAKKENPPRKG